jgi:hypothetical protein
MVSFSHIIDLDADPYIPVPDLPDYFPKNHPSRCISVAKHIRIGRLPWDPKKIWLYRAPRQTDSNPIYGKDLWDRDLVYRHVLNANLLDYLLAYPELIPEEWKECDVFFWGTIYKNECSEPNLVRCLRWSVDKWEPKIELLISFWNDRMPAAILDF